MSDVAGIGSVAADISSAVTPNQDVEREVERELSEPQVRQPDSADARNTGDAEAGLASGGLGDNEQVEGAATAGQSDTSDRSESNGSQDQVTLSQAARQAVEQAQNIAQGDSEIAGQSADSGERISVEAQQRQADRVDTSAIESEQGQTLGQVIDRFA
ncbi:MAG: hypothetical protein QF654_04335 [Alphaproteobacteria bacterium]|jgi:hypothetical protein|nr:hypothetical protein [Alphaproteobacteria bacterium]